jgi:formylglycine-generating enzyme
VGANPNVPATDAGGNGTGWQTAWNDSSGAANNLPNSLADFRTKLRSCSPGWLTWTDAADAGSPDENRAINCVNWYEAFAFCIWDGGRLPTEAEWEYAAAGGDQNRLYPWGNTPPDCTYSNFYNGGDCYGINGEVVAVGSMPKGDGRWGHADLAGNVSEPTLDCWGAYYAWQNDNYANVSCSDSRVYRSAAYASGADLLRAARRLYDDTYVTPSVGYGVRCARTP